MKWIKLLTGLVIFAQITSAVAEDTSGGNTAPAKPSAPKANLAADPVPLWKTCDGKTVRLVNIEVADVFDGDDVAGLYAAANSLKINTKDSVIKREMILKPGDTCNSFKIQESARNLRSLKFIRNVAITPSIDGDFVDLNVRVQDTWTLVPQLGFSVGTGRKSQSYGIVESNVLGYGKQLEATSSEDQSRQTHELLYQDNRFLDSYNRFILAGYDRSDGTRSLVSLARPFRSLVEKSAWAVDADAGDTIGRLFANNTERYIFRQDKVDFGTRYFAASGDPQVRVKRFFVGYDYIDFDFSQADLQDYEDLDLDPNEVSNDPRDVPLDRRFSGPVFGVESITPNFVSMNYIDRFDRVEDYNLGPTSAASIMIAPKSLGSLEDSMLFNANHAFGDKFDRTSFYRTEFNISTRYQEETIENSLLHWEAKYYNVLGNWFEGDWFLGKHTLAASTFVDYGDDLDNDRELLIGGDNAIRGYKAKTFTGDKRLAVNLEDRFHIAEDIYELVSVGGAVFLDAGGSTYDSFGSLVTDNMYSDVGVGLRFAFPRSSGSQVLRIDFAIPLRDGPDGSGSLEPRILITGGQLFGSRLRSESLGVDEATADIGFDK